MHPMNATKLDNERLRTLILSDTNTHDTATLQQWRSETDFTLLKEVIDEYEAVAAAEKPIIDGAVYARAADYLSTLPDNVYYQEGGTVGSVREYLKAHSNLLNAEAREYLEKEILADPALDTFDSEDENYQLLQNALKELKAAAEKQIQQHPPIDLDEPETEESERETLQQEIFGLQTALEFAEGAEAEQIKELISGIEVALEFLPEEKAKGGFVGKGELVWNKVGADVKLDFLIKNFTPEITPRTQEDISKRAYNFVPKNVKIKWEAKYANIDAGEYAKGGEFVYGKIIEATYRDADNYKYPVKFDLPENFSYKTGDDVPVTELGITNAQWKEIVEDVTGTEWNDERDHNIVEIDAIRAKQPTDTTIQEWNYTDGGGLRLRQKGGRTSRGIARDRQFISQQEWEKNLDRKTPGKRYKEDGGNMEEYELDDSSFAKGGKINKGDFQLSETQRLIALAEAGASKKALAELNEYIDLYTDSDDKSPRFGRSLESIINEYKNAVAYIKQNVCKVKNQYTGKTAEQVWDAWNPKQRAHFIDDHDLGDNVSQAMLQKSAEDLNAEKWGKEFGSTTKWDWIKNLLQEHVLRGQYAKGGRTSRGIARDRQFISQQEWEKNLNRKTPGKRYKAVGGFLAGAAAGVIAKTAYDNFDEIKKMLSESGKVVKPMAADKLPPKIRFYDKSSRIDDRVYQIYKSGKWENVSNEEWEKIFISGDGEDGRPEYKRHAESNKKLKDAWDNEQFVWALKTKKAAGGRAARSKKNKHEVGPGKRFDVSISRALATDLLSHHPENIMGECFVMCAEAAPAGKKWGTVDKRLLVEGKLPPKYQTFELWISGDITSEHLQNALKEFSETIK